MNPKNIILENIKRRIGVTSETSFISRLPILLTLRYSKDIQKAISEEEIDVLISKIERLFSNDPITKSRLREMPEYIASLLEIYCTEYIRLLDEEETKGTIDNPFGLGNNFY